ncbi:unnamed protein product [Ectocarpus sp. 4 AP-2014]
MVAKWRSADAAIELVAGSLTAKLAAAGLSAGLSDFSCDGHSLAERLFAASTPGGPLSQAAESYVRGADHVTTHPATEGFPFRTQLEWTVEPLGQGVLAAVLTISLQTDLLDTRPELLFETTASGTPSEAAGGGWKIETPEGPTLLLVPHPTDAPETDRVEGEATLGLRLASPFLEKGVIRRFRLAAIVLPAGSTDADMAAAVDSFRSLPLPLTT